jgi:hypothetical protein
MLWFESLSLALSIFYESLLLTPGFFPENEEISAPPPCDCQLEYIYFMKIGQPKVSERKNEKSGLVVTSQILRINSCKD